MKFSEIEYKRPDIEKAKEFFASAAERLAAAGSFEEAERVFLEVEDYSAAVGSMLTVANIRHDIDTRDEFYDAESAFIDAAGPELTEYEQRWNEAMLKTPFRARFEEKYNRLMFLNTEIDLRTFSPEIVPEMQKENALVSEYSKLLASAQIPFEGREWTLSQLSPVKQDPDEARRAAAWAAEDRWYTERQPRLDAIYAELVGLRDAMGRKLGYENFIPLGYDRMQRNCYAKEDVERFRAAVREYIVPIAEQVYSRVAARLGKTLPMGYADCAMWYTDGNAKPVGTPEEIMENGRRFYHELSGETAEFIDFMFERGLFDVLSPPREGRRRLLHDAHRLEDALHLRELQRHERRRGGYNPRGGPRLRELHRARYRPRAERLALARGLRGALDEHGVLRRGLGGALLRPAADKFRWQHLADAITFIPYGTLVDHFQHECYEHPAWTPEERNARWLELQRAYMPWLKPEEGLGFYASGRAWQRQRHIYEYPFYYIDYCLAQTVALEFWAMIREDRAATWEKYMAYTRPAGTLTFRELLRQAGSATPSTAARSRPWPSRAGVAELQRRALKYA